MGRGGVWWLLTRSSLLGEGMSWGQGLMWAPHDLSRDCDVVSTDRAPREAVHSQNVLEGMTYEVQARTYLTISRVTVRASSCIFQVKASISMTRQHLAGLRLLGGHL